MKLSSLTVAAALILAANSFVIPRQESCTTENDCEGDLYCKNGVCTALGQPGDQCDTNDDCDGETPCINGVCGTGEEDPNTLQPEGGSCSADEECEGDLACLGGICTALQPEGGPCTANEECEGELSCQSGVCATEGEDPNTVQPEGGPCSADEECEGELACLSNICTALQPEGGPCTANEECEGELSCQAGICTAEGEDPGTTGQEGDPCTTNEECEGDLICTAGICAQGDPNTLGGEGDLCFADEECQPGLTCVNNLCAAGASGYDFRVLFPGATSVYHVDSGAIEFNTGHGLVSKTQGSGADTSALVTFAFPADVANKQCEFFLELDNAALHLVYASGSQKVDVFSSLYPAAEDRNEWGPGNGRNQHMGRMNVVDGGFSTAEWGLTFPCPASQTLGYEVVATGDSQHVEWWEPADGLRVKVLE